MDFDLAKSLGMFKTWHEHFESCPVRSDHTIADAGALFHIRIPQ